jgi:O-antigen/teichoic acid export membrane protein
VLAYFFPRYFVDPIILDALIFSLPVYPIVVALGAILIGQKKSIQYLLLIAFALLSDWLFLGLANPYYGYRAAAVAQLGALFVYSTLLLILVFYLFKESIEKKAIKLLKIYGSTAGLYVSYFFIKYLIFN